MTSFRQNLLANLAGVGWSAALQFLCVPFYVRLMGIESYALVGFFLTLQATLQMLDLGATPTMSREMARYSTQPERAGEVRSFVRTFEVGYWAVGLVLGGLVVLLAPVLATRWVNSVALPSGQVVSAVMAMGVLIALQWPLSLYQGGLQGLQRQVELNVLRIVMATLSGVGGVVILWTVSAEVTVFFAWQALVSVLHVVLITTLFWRRLPPRTQPTRVSFALVRPILGFATGMGGITLFGMLLLQMDKLVLSKLLSLEAFGYYVLAGTVANGLQLFIRPLYTAIFPRFSALVAAGDEAGVRQLYHQGTQLMAVLVLPSAAVLGFFSLEVVRAWTGDAVTAAQTAPLVTVLVFGTALFAMMHLPYALQLAYGWTTIGLILTVGMVVLLLPLLILSARASGAVGAARIWALLNVGYMAVGIPWTHARLLKGSAGRWLLADFALPLAGTLGVVLAARLLLPDLSSRLQTLALLGAVGLVATAVAVLLAPAARLGLHTPVKVVGGSGG